MHAPFLVGFHPTFNGSSLSSAISWAHFVDGGNSRRRYLHKQRVKASSSAAEINNRQDHYVVLGLTRSATIADIKKAYRLLARKYHPDVSKHSKASELFKSVHCAYEVLSNALTRAQYDRELGFHKDTSHPYRRKKYRSDSDLEDDLRAYKWAEQKWRSQREKYWKHHHTNETHKPENEVDDRAPFSKMIGSLLISVFLLKTVGARVSLAFSSLTALFDRKLDAGYKIGYVTAWALGGKGGILLTICLSFASWVCGKRSSNLVVLFGFAVWFGSIVVRYAPLPQGALVTLLYMSIKLQHDLK